MSWALAKIARFPGGRSNPVATWKRPGYAGDPVGRAEPGGSFNPNGPDAGLRGLGR